MNDIRHETEPVTLEAAVCKCGKALSECTCENGGECDCDGECERGGQVQVVSIGQIGDSVKIPTDSRTTTR